MKELAKGFLIKDLHGNVKGVQPMAKPMKWQKPTHQYLCVYNAPVMLPRAS